MAKLVAVSLQKFSPIASEYTKLDTTSDEELSIITKFFCIWQPNLTRTSVLSTNIFRVQLTRVEKVI